MIVLDEWQSALKNGFAGGAASACGLALAGVGKTELIRQCVMDIPQSVLPNVVITAFNNHSITDIERLFNGYIRKGKQLRTTYSLGLSLLYQALRPLPSDSQNWVDERKYNYIVSDLLAPKRLPEREEYMWQDSLCDLWNMVRLMLTDIDSIEDVNAVIFEHVPDAPFSAKDVIGLLADLKRIGLEQARRCIDFTDQIWIPCVKEFRPRRPMSVIVVDESQDLNAAQHRLLTLCANEKTSWLIMGDVNQAIYGWAGAAPDGMRILAKQVGITKKEVYRIPINYRCPLVAIRRAQAIVPELQARPDAPEGILEHIKMDRFIDVARDGVAGKYSLLVASRTQAPLVTLCLELVNAGIPAHVKGKGFSKNIIAAINEVEGISSDFTAFYDTLRELRQRKVSAFAAMGRDTESTEWHDRCETLEALFFRVRIMGHTSFNAMKSEAAAIFKDDGRGVKLATWHSSKGLEADVVVSVRPEDMPHVKALSPAARQEEERVRYIEATRSKGQHLLLSGQSLKG